MPENIRKKLDEEGIETMDDLFLWFLNMGCDPMKLVEKGDKEDNDWDDELDDDEDHEELEDEDYLLGLTLPKQKFIGPMKQEFHIRIKLNNAPVNIWRELVVPSNITL